MSIARARTLSLHSLDRSLTIRPRLTLLVPCSIRSRRGCGAWLVRCCAHGSSWPQGVLVGMRIAIWGRVNAQKPRVCNNRSRQGREAGWPRPAACPGGGLQPSH